MKGSDWGAGGGGEGGVGGGGGGGTNKHCLLICFHFLYIKMLFKHGTEKHC